MYCSSCGEEVNDNAKFCSSCGESVQGDSTHHVNKSQEETTQKEPTQKGSHFDFKSGLYGILGGIVVILLAGAWFGSAQYIYPTQAAIAMWLFILGLGIFVLPPLWYWIVNPIRHRI